MAQEFPILDDHFHLNRRTGKGPEVIKEFMRSGGTHIVLVTLPSWSCGVTASKPEDFREVFDSTLADAEAVRALGCTCYCMAGVHPAEVGRLLERMSLEEAESLMKGGLDLAAEYVADGKCIGIKSGRPHYPVSPEVWEMSNRVLSHALTLAGELDCPLQIHAESGPCDDVIDMAKKQAWIQPVSLSILQHVILRFTRQLLPASLSLQTGSAMAKCLRWRVILWTIIQDPGL